MVTLAHSRSAAMKEKPQDGMIPHRKHAKPFAIRSRTATGGLE
jgi:hypothetical protein